MSAFRRNTGARRRGPSPIFKRRFALISNVLVNATTSTLAQIVIRETSTIYALKVCLAFTPQSATYADNDSMRTLVCMVRTRSGQAVGTTLLSNIIATETIDGFLIGCREVGFRRGSDATDGALPLHVDSQIDEKYRFRRKTDEGDAWNLVARSNVTTGSARDVLISGFIEFIIRVR